MKLRNTTKSIVYTLLTFIFFSCSREANLNNKSVIKIENNKVTKFDKFLEREFLNPYNIEVVYKYEDIETNLDYNVTPATEEKAIQMVNLIKYLCLDAYARHTDKNFLKKYFPKKIVLIGSGAYNDNKTVILGTAQGGVKIVLYDINSMDPTDAALLVDRYFNTIFHEFSHILHQNKRFTADYEKVSLTNYVGDEWNKYWKQYPSYTKGFVSDYSSKNKNEDFVEVISHYITLSESKWNDVIDPDLNNPNTEGVEMVNKKLSIVKSYLRDSWSIDLDDMKTEVQNRLNNIGSIDINNID